MVIVCHKGSEEKHDKCMGNAEMIRCGCTVCNSYVHNLHIGLIMSLNYFDKDCIGFHFVLEIINVTAILATRIKAAIGNSGTDWVPYTSI